MLSNFFVKNEPCIPMVSRWRIEKLSFAWRTLHYVLSCFPLSSSLFLSLAMVLMTHNLYTDYIHIYRYCKFTLKFALETSKLWSYKFFEMKRTRGFRRNNELLSGLGFKRSHRGIVESNSWLDTTVRSVLNLETNSSAAQLLLPTRHLLTCSLPLDHTNQPKPEHI